MAATNITFKLDENVKSEFEEFCENVGMNITTAINMFIRATLRERELPFRVADLRSDMQTFKRKRAMEDLWETTKLIQADSVRNGTDKMTMDDINVMIAECRAETRAE